MTEPSPGLVEDREIPEYAPIAVLSLLALLLLGLLWGYNWVVMKVVLVDVSSAWFAALRTVLPALLIITLYQRRQRRNARRRAQLQGRRGKSWVNGLK